MVKIGIVGAKGYAGEELIKILLKHSKVKIVSLADKIEEGKQNINVIYPYLKGKLDLECIPLDIEEIAQKTEVVFLALPHKVSMDIVASFYNKGKVVIDLSADFRIKNKKIYEKWYATTHTQTELLSQAVYGLPELYRDKIKKTHLVANPGCYPTGIILGCAPLVEKKMVRLDAIIADCKSGVTGAGRQFVQNYLNSEGKENLKAYNIGVHRHTPEIEQELTNLAGEEIVISFTPHLIPIMRGILSTIYFIPLKKFTTQEIIDLYKEYYKNELFMKIFEEGHYPETRDVVGTNYCVIGIKTDQRTNRIIIITAIDNLIKGASGQAVQNMNIICGFEETKGLI